MIPSQNKSTPSEACGNETGGRHFGRSTSTSHLWLPRIAEARQCVQHSAGLVVGGGSEAQTPFLQGGIGYWPGVTWMSAPDRHNVNQQHGQVSVESQAPPGRTVASPDYTSTLSQRFCPATSTTGRRHKAQT